MMEVVEKTKFDLLFENSSDAFFFLRPTASGDWDFMDVNPVACRMLGIEKEVLLEMQVGELLPLGVLEDHLAPRKKGSGMSYPFRQWELKRGDGRRVFVDLTFHATGTPEDKVILVIARDLTDSMQAYEAIRKSERKQLALYNAVPDMVIHMDRSGRLLKLVSGKDSRDWGLFSPEIMGEGNLGKPVTLFSLLPPEVMGQARTLVDDVLENKVMQVVEFQSQGTGRSRYYRDYEARICPVDQEELVVFIREITNRKRRAANLARSEERLQVLFNHNPMMVFTTGADMRIRSVNTSMQNAMEQSEMDLKGCSLDALCHPEDSLWIKECFMDYLEGPQEAFSCEFRMAKANGDFFWVEAHAKATDGLKGDRVVVISCEDITRRREAEHAIMESLRDKEVLLREVHHRVKNNLQIIISILSLQINRVDNPQLHIALKNSQDRIRAMALIHENLYRSEGLANINPGEYFPELCNSLFAAYAIEPGRINIQYNIDANSLELELAIPLGLILNELVINVFKYAFKEQERGSVDITLQESNGEMQLVFKDDGAGLPEGFDFKESNTLGLRLIRTLVRQIRGEVEFKNENGLAVYLSFKKHFEEY